VIEHAQLVKQITKEKGWQERGSEWKRFMGSFATVPQRAVSLHIKHKVGDKLAYYKPCNDNELPGGGTRGDSGCQ